MKQFRTTIFLLLFIAAPFLSKGQDAYDDLPPNNDYNVKAAQIRAEVWAWDIPAFKNYSVPEKYAGESAVILARHRMIDASAQKGNVFRAFFLGDASGRMFYTDIDRQMVKINDQAALDKFSEFSFKEESKYSNYGIRMDIAQTVLGARIIKPDGSITEVDVSGISVSMTEGKDNEESYKKLAIPELQKGDILDWFVCYIYEFSRRNVPVQNILFFSADYPLLHCSCQLTFGKNLTIEYRSVNGAPELEKSVDQQGNTVLSAETENVMRVNDLENMRWLSPLRDLPMIRVSILQNASKAFFRPKSARAIGVHENVPYESIVEDAKWFLGTQKRLLNPISATKKKVSKIVSGYKKDNPGSSSEELADVIYTALYFAWGESSFYNTGTFILMLDQLLKENGIECKIGHVTNKSGAPLQEIVTDDDLWLLLVANEGKQCFFPALMVPGEIPSDVQGQTGFIFTLNYISVEFSGMPEKINTDPQIPVNVPESTAQDNVNINRIEVSLLPEDNGGLLIHRQVKYTGNLKRELQSLLLTFEGWDTSMRRYLHIDKSLIEEFNEKRRTKKWIEKVEGKFEKEREESAETIKQEIFDYHQIAPQEVKNFSFTSWGVTKTEPDLIYDVTYSIDGLVRKAGNNLILDAGKLIGTQWAPTDNDRNRNVDAYLPTAMTFENEISFVIPKGYKAGNIDHMNVDYSNEYMSFRASADIKGDTINIRTQKSYLKTFVPKGDWSQLIDIVDKTNDFYSNSIILQKNQ